MVRVMGRSAQGWAWLDCPSGLGQCDGTPDARGRAQRPMNSSMRVHKKNIGARQTARCRPLKPGPDRCIMEKTLGLLGCGLLATLTTLVIVGGCNSDEIRLDSAGNSQGGTDPATGSASMSASMSASATESTPTGGSYWPTDSDAGGNSQGRLTVDGRIDDGDGQHGRERDGQHGRERDGHAGDGQHGRRDRRHGVYRRDGDDGERGRHRGRYGRRGVRPGRPAGERMREVHGGQLLRRL